MAPPGVTPNPQMQPTNAGWPELRLVSSLLEAIRNVGFHRSFAADLLFVMPRGRASPGVWLCERLPVA
jgi:hypothetical protein